MSILLFPEQSIAALVEAVWILVSNVPVFFLAASAVSTSVFV